MNQRTPCLPEPTPAQIPLRGHQDSPGQSWVGIMESISPVLLVEDDPVARKFIRITLQKAGFKVHEAGSGEEALDLFERHPTQVALLDIGLPGMDGFELCQKLRQRSEAVAILILTGRGDDSDKVSGLELGADDYLVKPFGPDVLVARIRAVLRRYAHQSQVSNTLSLGDLRLECLTMKVFKGGREVDLTPREFALLAAFLRHPGEVLTREQLRDEIWGEHHFGSAKALDVFVCKLREKLEDDPAHPQHFKTEWGVGFVCC